MNIRHGRLCSEFNQMYRKSFMFKGMPGIQSCHSGLAVKDTSWSSLSQS
jgi:hypothetical protein